MTTDPQDVAPGTWAVVGGRGTPAAGDPLNVGPVLASNFVHGGDRYYAREHGNAGWEAFEALLGGWEGGEAVAFASGMAAVAAVFGLVPAGGKVVLPTDCYQRVGHLAEEGARAGRWSVERVPITDAAAWARAVGDGVDLLWLESPTNPLLEVGDLRAIGAAAAGSPRTLVAVDNTLATPLAQQPLALGADVVVHSATKHIGGHSDLLLGAAVAHSGAVAERLREARALAGAVPGALETYLAVRGARTLPLRWRAASASAAVLAQRLGAHAEVEVVRHFGTMISFDVRGGAARADALCRALRIVQHATSLGGVESTIERRAGHPGQEHLPESLLRLSVGCEEAEDLWRDLSRALEATAAS
jgi:cystathionine gamma-synthase